MISSLKTYPLLAGYRGGPAYDIAALARSVSQFSQLVADPSANFDSFEINPVIVRPEGGGLIALDAVIEALPETSG